VRGGAPARGGARGEWIIGEEEKRKEEEKKEKKKERRGENETSKKKGGRKERREKKKMRGEKGKKIQARAILTLYHLNRTSEAVLPNVFQNGSNSTREATPPDESEPKPFFRSRSPAKQALRQRTNPCIFQAS
jgi:hypothetical protein